VGIGVWGLGIGHNPQSPIPNPQSPINILLAKINLIKEFNYIFFNLLVKIFFNLNYFGI